MPLTPSFTDFNGPDAGYSAIKQKRTAILCESWGRGWIWFPHQGLLSTKAGQGPGPGVTSSSPVGTLTNDSFDTCYFRSRNLLGQKTRTPISELQIFARGLASGYAIFISEYYSVSTRIQVLKANMVSINLDSFRDKLGFRQRAGSIAGFGSKKHQIN